MNRSMITAAFVAASSLAALAPAANAGPVKQPAHYDKCYGISTAGKNDCAAGAHSCAGQSTMSRDKSSFVYLPAGACGKIAGGSLSAS